MITLIVVCTLTLGSGTFALTGWQFVNVERGYTTPQGEVPVRITLKRDVATADRAQVLEALPTVCTPFQVATAVGVVDDLITSRCCRRPS